MAGRSSIPVLATRRRKPLGRPLLDGPLRGRPLTRIIATHFHPDHVGAAGFLLQHFDVPLYMSATEYLQSLNIHLDPGALEAEHYRRFYLDHGLDTETTQTRRHQRTRLSETDVGTAADLSPRGRRRCAAHRRARIRRADRRRAFARRSHADVAGRTNCFSPPTRCCPTSLPMSASLRSTLKAIRSDITLRSLRALRRDIPDDVLVLPGHNLPFYGLHARVAELIEPSPSALRSHRAGLPRRRRNRRPS